MYKIIAWDENTRKWNDSFYRFDNLGEAMAFAEHLTLVFKREYFATRV